MLTSASYRYIRNVLPEAICCCLQTCYVDVILLLMDCVCILTSKLLILTTGMDRPHQNTHSIKKCANYMVGKGVKLNDVIFHIVHHLLLLLLL